MLIKFKSLILLLLIGQIEYSPIEEFRAEALHKYPCQEQLINDFSNAINLKFRKRLWKRHLYNYPFYHEEELKELINKYGLL